MNNKYNKFSLYLALLENYISMIKSTVLIKFDFQPYQE